MYSPTSKLFQRALDLEEPWQIISVKLTEDTKELHIYLDFTRGGRFQCPKCKRQEVTAYDSKEKIWRHLNFFQYKTYLHCPVPRIECPDCGIKTVDLPWARPGSGFTLLFEAFMMALSREMPVKAAARLVGEHDTRIWRIIHHYVDEARDKEFFADVHRVGIDETSRKRGHHYVTLFVDLDESRVIYATEGKDSGTIGRFSNDFHDHGGDSGDVREVCCDMSPAFIFGVEACLPNADITFDRFHVMKIMNDAVDKVRREEQARQECLKRSRYVWLKNPENLTAKQRILLDELSQQNLQTARAYRIRLSLRDFWNQPESMAEDYLKRWYFWATHSRLEPVKQAAYTIKRHWEGIVNYSKSNITNGILEGINGLVQAARNKARGYRSVKNFIAIIYMIAGKLKFSIPT